MAGGSKTGSLETKKLTRQRLGFGGEKVRGKEDGYRGFLFALKLYLAHSQMASMANFISY